MGRRFVTADVFAAAAFGGNQLAVVLDAAGLTDAQMQAIATEFNYSETTFVLPPVDPAHTARVRIFTPRVEVPFAGHPNVGTAVMLARDLQGRGVEPGEGFLFEEAAGLVPVRLLREQGAVVGAELTAPEALSVRARVSVEDAADCLGLAAAEISTHAHRPQVCSVGLPFLLVEVSSRDALRRARPRLEAHERVLPPAGTDAIYVYCHGTEPGELHARTFAPVDGCLEDPATGSATGAAIALLASLTPQQQGEASWRIHQGVDMGRPSLILGRTQKQAGKVSAVQVAGRVIPMMSGQLPELPN
jgi:trans-2,3-dihydro-3-hydroxyanthranilate isomerase